MPNMKLDGASMFSKVAAPQGGNQSPLGNNFRTTQGPRTHHTRLTKSAPIILYDGNGSNAHNYTDVPFFVRNPSAKCMIHIAIGYKSSVTETTEWTPVNNVDIWTLTPVVLSGSQNEMMPLTPVLLNRSLATTQGYEVVTLADGFTGLVSIENNGITTIGNPGRFMLVVTWEILDSSCCSDEEIAEIFSLCELRTPQGGNLPVMSSNGG